jgi:hypothetical protein
LKNNYKQLHKDHPEKEVDTRNIVAIIFILYLFVILPFQIKSQLWLSGKGNNIEFFHDHCMVKQQQNDKRLFFVAIKWDTYIPLMKEFPQHKSIPLLAMCKYH